MHDSSPTSLTALSREECLRLLATVPIGRLVFTRRALPAIHPVNFVLDGASVIVRTAAGSKLAAAVNHAVVAFEADELDFETRTGWSVTVIGHSREITDAAELRRLRELPLDTWGPGPRDHIICIKAELVTGRRLEHVLGRETIG
jgi:nitroimidazol reductase NimA-like FMN-containing flavoprotein (pyridoxamine 5'-phosphate oxidase superfamily)